MPPVRIGSGPRQRAPRPPRIWRLTSSVGRSTSPVLLFGADENGVIDTHFFRTTGSVIGAMANSGWPGQGPVCGLRWMHSIRS